MQPSDGERFRAVMAGMSRLYDKHLDEPLLDVYWTAMRNWTIEDFQAAATRLVETSKWMPRPADFNELRNAARPTPGEAWIGAGKSKDPIVQRALHAATQGRYFGHIPLDEMQWVQKRFVEFYEEMRDVDDVRVALPHYDPARSLGGPEDLKRLNDVLKRIEGVVK